MVPLRDPPDSWSMRRQFAHLSDEALVALVARNDETALAELYDRVGRVAYGLAFRVLRDDRLAEDAVQEAFLGVWRTAAGFRAERAKASTWILTLVHRRAVDLVRREERRRAEPLDETHDVATTESAEDAAWLGFERERVQEGLRQLPHVQREAIELAYYGGFSQSELSERLGVPLGTIKSRMFAGLSRLRELLQDGAEEGSWKSHIHELTAGYALDALDPAEREAFEAHLEGCEQCQEELASFWEVTGGLAAAADGPAPSPALRERILEAARAEQQNVVPIELAAARLARARGGDGDRRRGRDRARDLRGVAERAARRLEGGAERAGDAAAVLADANATTVNMNGGSGKVVVDDGGHRGARARRPCRPLRRARPIRRG